jgi:hypothetical protein
MTIPPEGTPGTDQFRTVRNVSLGTLGSGEIIVSVWGSDVPTDVPRTTATDIARLLVKREIRKAKEKLAKPLSATDAAMLDRRRSELLQGFPAAASAARIRAFELLAEVISEERLVYAVRTTQQARLVAEIRKRKRGLEALRLVIGSMDSDWRRLVKTFKNPSTTIVDELRRLAPAPTPVLATPWHASAVRLAAAYQITLDGRLQWSRDGDVVRFVELALEEIGARPGSRAAIDRVLRMARKS